MPRFAKYEKGDEPIEGYRLAEFIGAGQFGEVWKAQEFVTRKWVAIKLIDLSHSLSALKELKGLNLVINLNHPNLVPIYTARLKDKNGAEMPLNQAEEVKQKRPGQLSELVIAMGLGEQSLAGRLKQINADGTTPENYRGIPADELLGYMLGAAKGIDYLNRADHGIGAGDGPIIHCDIKPDNMMLVAGEVQIADAGVAVIIHPDVRATKAAGSPAYSAPELTGNKPTVGTDQYALAISYYELRTGKLPFDEHLGGMLSIMLAHAEGRLDFSSPNITPSEVEILVWATALQPAKRYASCTDMVRQLARAVANQPTLEPSQITSNGRGHIPVPPTAAATPAASAPRDNPTRPSGELSPAHREQLLPTWPKPGEAERRTQAAKRSPRKTLWTRVKSMFGSAGVPPPTAGKQPQDLRWTVVSGTPTAAAVVAGVPIHQVFISYRREDSADITGRMLDRLRLRFDQQVVFRDVDTIPYGYDFRDVIKWALNRCQVMIVVIGPNWLTTTDEQGEVRLQNPSDYLRFEVETGLARGIPVIPVVVTGAGMPKEHQLPDALKNLAYRHGIAVRRDPDFDHDMERLIRGLQGILAEEFV